MADPTPEEQERIDRLRAQVADAGLPEGVEIDFKVIDPDEMPGLIAAADAAVFLKPTGYGVHVPKGTRRSYREPERVLPPLPSIELDGPDWLEKAVLDGTVTCGAFGIGNAIEGVEVPLFASFQFSIGADYTPVIIWIDDAPAAWVERAMHRFCLVFPKGEDGLQPWIATGPLTRFEEGVVVPPNLSRNDPCPCGSGKKFKRCHGAG